VTVVAYGTTATRVRGSIRSDDRARAETRRPAPALQRNRSRSGGRRVGLKDSLLLQGILHVTSLSLIAAAGILLVTRARSPQSGCGCFGARSHAAITKRTIARPAALALIALGPAAAGGGSWTEVLDRPAALAVLLIEAILIIAAIPELRSPRQSRPEWARQRELRRAVRAVRRSQAFRDIQAQLPSSQPSDAWVDPERAQRVVIFELGGHQPGSERFLAFRFRPNVPKSCVLASCDSTRPAKAGKRPTTHPQWPDHRRAECDEIEDRLLPGPLGQNSCRRYAAADTM
jgi:hypothetical protein